MQLDISTQSEITVVKLNEARLDAALAPEFKTTMVGLVNDGHTKLVLDLSALDFMDSSGLGSIVSVLKALGGKGDFIITGAKGTVDQLFKLTRMDRVFTLLGSVEDGINKING